MIVTGTCIILEQGEYNNVKFIENRPIFELSKIERLLPVAKRVVYDETAVKAVAELMRSNKGIRFMTYMTFTVYAAYIKDIRSIDIVRENYPEEQTNFGKTEIVLEELVNKVVYYLGIIAAGASAQVYNLCRRYKASSCLLVTSL